MISTLSPNKEFYVIPYAAYASQYIPKMPILSDKTDIQKRNANCYAIDLDKDYGLMHDELQAYIGSVLRYFCFRNLISINVYNRVATQLFDLYKDCITVNPETLVRNHYTCLTALKTVVSEMFISSEYQEGDNPDFLLHLLFGVDDEITVHTPQLNIRKLIGTFHLMYLLINFYSKTNYRRLDKSKITEFHQYVEENPMQIYYV